MERWLGWPTRPYKNIVVSWNVFEIMLEKCEAFVQNISKEKVWRHVFVVNELIYPLSKFRCNRTKSLSVGSLQCPLQVKKLMRENTKYVHQTGIFYFQLNLFQFSIFQFPIMHSVCPPKFCINYCCEMLLGGLHIPKSISQ